MILGQNEKAMQWLERTSAEKIGLLSIINVEPCFDPIRSEPRFQALLRKLGIENSGQDSK